MGEYHKENIRIAKNTMIVYVRMVVVILIGLMSTRYVLAALGQSDYGLYGVVGGLIAMLGFLSTAMNTTTRRFINIEMGRDGGNVNRVFNILMTVHICLALVILVLAETFGLWYINCAMNLEPGRLDDAIFVFHVSTLVACMGIVNLPFQSLIEANEKFIASSVIDILTNVVKFALILLLVFYKGNALRFYAVCMSVVTFLSLLLYHWYCRRHWADVIRWKFVKDRAAYKEIIIFNNWTAMSAAAFIARTQGSTILVNYFFGTFVNGAMRPAYDLENFSVMAINRLSNASSPQITQNYGKGNLDRSLDLVCKISRFSALLMTLLVFCLLVELPFVLGLWLKDVPEGAVLFCRLTLISALVRSFTGGTQTLEQASGKIKWFQIVNSAMSLACLPAGFFMFKAGKSAETIILLYICYSVVYRFVEMVLLRRLLAFNSGKYLLKAYLRPLAVIAIMILYILAYRFVMPSDAGIFLRLSGIAATVLTCCLSVFFVGMHPWERASVRILINKVL